MTDQFREWDAAYLLGALSPGERRAFEQHLATCPECAASVASMAGVPGVLAVLPADRALATIAPPAITPPAPNLMPGLARAAQRRTRRRAVVVAAAAVATAAVACVGFFVPRDTPAEPTGQVVSLAQIVTSKLHAKVRIVDEPWGTTIQTTCMYDRSPSSSTRARGYALFVTDSYGTVTQIASWSAAPGSIATPTATTKLSRAEIRTLDIRSTESGRVLLKASL
ncbi:zf-HC2 domain-containing protein [Kribbella sp. NBC_01245]|uniref:anti-sigma factor family protein n=1 Tax=Kribbella sp. NBC_01245 TaxID=2903578 RepID=UPI002E289B85|nr:zf-HC2 domain-containing protein [Kribbella sp. NBC_01245]